MDKKYYKIGHIKYYQSELLWGEKKRLIQLFDRMRKRINPQEELKLESAFDLAGKYDVLSLFAGIILKYKNPLWEVWFTIVNFIRFRPRWYKSMNKLSDKQLKEIKEDFFFLNSDAMNLLRNLGTAFSLIANQAMKSTTINRSGSKTSTRAGKPNPKADYLRRKQSNTTPLAETRQQSDSLKI